MAEGYERMTTARRELAYFCAVLPDGADAAESEHRSAPARCNTSSDRLQRSGPGPSETASSTGMCCSIRSAATGADRLEAQYFRANVAATDRYVTTPAGSVDARLDPGRSGFENLVLAGDWTHNGIDGGCVEAAVISGERAARR